MTKFQLDIFWKSKLRIICIPLNTKPMVFTFPVIPSFVRNRAGPIFTDRLGAGVCLRRNLLDEKCVWNLAYQTIQRSKVQLPLLRFGRLRNSKGNRRLANTGCSVPVTRVVRDDETEGSIPSSPTEQSEGGVSKTTSCFA